jgi:hypothetical protein
VEGAHLQQLADAIDAFARWDRSHLQEFILADGRRLYDPDPDWEIEGELSEDYRRMKLSRLHPGEQFAYVSDLGDDWTHPCTAGARRIDPAEVLGIPPETPLSYRGWGRHSRPVPAPLGRLRSRWFTAGWSLAAASAPRSPSR